MIFPPVEEAVSGFWAHACLGVYLVIIMLVVGCWVADAILPCLDSSHYLMGLLTLSVSLALTLPTTVPTARFSGTFHS